MVLKVHYVHECIVVKGQRFNYICLDRAHHSQLCLKNKDNAPNFIYIMLEVMYNVLQVCNTNI